MGCLGTGVWGRQAGFHRLVPGVTQDLESEADFVLRVDAIEDEDLGGWLSGAES